jgi:hypothetical protein
MMMRWAGCSGPGTAQLHCCAGALPFDFILLIQAANLARSNRVSLNYRLNAILYLSLQIFQSIRLVITV